MDTRVAGRALGLNPFSLLVRDAGWFGVVAIILLIGLVGGTLLVLLTASPAAVLSTQLADPYLYRVVGFTVWQASLSTLLSVFLAIPTARAFARRDQFPGRGALLRLMGLPIVTPVIVAVLGIVAVYGESGLLNRYLEPIGLSWRGHFYGLTGILLAHVFFNLPLSIRMLLPAWERIPGENWRLAAQLGMTAGQRFRQVEWPALVGVLPGTISVVFLLCFTSFAVVLVLGGGPRATTIEVAIYQALRFDFEPGLAAWLALGQLGICLILVVALHRWLRAPPVSRGLKTGQLRALGFDSANQRWFDGILLTAVCGFVALPLAAVIWLGLNGPLARVLSDSALWSAAGRSALISTMATTLALALALGLTLSARRLSTRHRQRTADGMLLAGSMTLAVPPMVIGSGLFLLLLPLGLTFDIATALIAIVNATLILPYLVRTIGPALMNSGARYQRLCLQLGMSGWQRFRLIDWPLLRKPLGFAVALAATLSFGDMGVAALFDTTGMLTLPVMLYHQLGAYRFNEAAVTALVLIVLCALVFIVVEHLVGQWRS